ncbi:hypothetical protein Pelo_12210 [Pelomyxa schiedti]|nr:hypothetical protein Pelo_12210 [Pelomyxa schiedti]
MSNHTSCVEWLTRTFHITLEEVMNSCITARRCGAADGPRGPHLKYWLHLKAFTSGQLRFPGSSPLPHTQSPRGLHFVGSFGKDLSLSLGIM